MRLIALLLLGLSALPLAGCSKNEAASAACTGSGNASSCETCCTANGASGYKYLGAGSCSCLGGNASAPAPVPVTGAATSFAGTYKSNWGPTVFTQTGTSVSAKYPTGTMTCTATGATLDCDWREPKESGKAKLTRDASGAIKGTWGKGPSATNGGTWLFSP